MKSLTSIFTENPEGLFGIEIEHVKIKSKEFKEKTALLERGHELKGYTNASSQVNTYRLSTNPQVYSTLVLKFVSTGLCLSPSAMEIIASQETQTPKEAIQLHFDALKYLNDSGY